MITKPLARPSRAAPLRPVPAFLLLLLLPALAAVAAAPGLPPADDLGRFITRRGDRLYDGDQEFRFVSVNMPDCLQIITNYRFDGDQAATRYRLPDEFELRDCVRTVRLLGGRVLRTFVITCSKEPGPFHMFAVGGDTVQPNEEALRVLDRLLQVCHEEGVRLIVPLIAYNSPIRGNPDTYGPDFWKVGSAANRKFKDVVTRLLHRTNSCTGVPYLEDRAILGWHTGNELVIGDDPDRRAWLHDFAAFLKQLDPHHLVIDGRNRPADIHGRYDEFLADPHLDAVSYHTYVNLPQAGTPRDTLRLMRNLTRGRMPLLVTEVAMYTPPDALRDLLAEIIADGTVGANWWGLRFHNRDGGFYKHSDKGSQFEDLNWPGFARGPAQPAEIDRERELLAILADHAWRIRGLPRPSLPPPDAPRLLPMADSGHLSWQGATGASAYTLQRAEDPAGPWTTLAPDLGDHLVSYSAQYCDRTAAPGRDYFYRIFARNAAGESPTSNVVGPVRNERRWQVDELFDLVQSAAGTANLRIVQSYAHTAYLEDIAVAVRTDPAQPAQLVYRGDGAIREFTATIHDAEVVPRIYVLDPQDRRREIQPEIATFDRGRRRRLTARLTGPETALVLELAAGAAPGQAVGRVEIATLAP